MTKARQIMLSFLFLNCEQWLEGIAKDDTDLDVAVQQ